MVYNNKRESVNSRKLKVIFCKRHQLKEQRVFATLILRNHPPESVSINVYLFEEQSGLRMLKGVVRIKAIIILMAVRCWSVFILGCDWCQSGMSRCWQIRNPGTNSKFMRLLVQHNEMIVLCNVLLRLQVVLFLWVSDLIYLVEMKLSIDGAGLCMRILNDLAEFL